MIPKQLFFIWFGDNKPNYVDFSISKFKEVNPDFNIEFIHEKDPFSSSNEDIKECIELKNTYFKNFLNRKFCIERFGNYPLMVFSDIYRFYLLKKYGGIYLDCDTFPVKPFDDELLNNDGFYCSLKCNKHGDIFFLGSQPNIDILQFNNNHDKCILFNNTIKNFNVLEQPHLLIKNVNYSKLWKKFHNLELIYGECYYNKFYIDHYISGKWRKYL
jgi:mannosyltransferase OCH1-like enzyme